MKQTNHKRLFFISLAILSTSFQLFSQQLIGSISVEGRNITNLSGAINDSVSFHILINKTSNGFNSKIYFFDNEKELKSFEIYNDESKPDYVCFHTNDSTLTLLRESKDKKTIIQDINYVNEKIAVSELDILPKHIFSHKNITFIVGKVSNQSYPIAFIKNSTNADLKFIKPTNQVEREFFIYMNKKSEFVDDQRYLVNGPILEYKGFYDGRELIFINDNKLSSSINVLNINPSSGTITTKTILINEKNGLKRFSSFVKDALLFTFFMYEEESFLDIYNLNSLELVKTFHYTKTEFGPHNKIVMRGEDITKTFIPKKFYNDFTPQLIGSMYNPALNISVNNTTENEYVLRIGHLDKNSYKNGSTANFWWHSEPFMSYNLNSGNLSFNPAGVAQIMIYQALADAKNTGNYFELNLNRSLEQIEKVSQYQYYDIDEKVYNDKLIKVMTLKKQFYIPLNNYVRFINFDEVQMKYNIYNLYLPSELN